MAVAVSGDGRSVAAMSLVAFPLLRRGLANGIHQFRRNVRGRGYSQGTVDSEEIERFRKLAGQWGDQEGPFKLLHRMTPLRVQYIREHWRHPQPLSRTKVLDVGTGGGLLALVCLSKVGS